MWSGMWRTINNVLIASMSRGLFVPACLFFLAFLMLYKTPDAYLPELWKALGHYWYWGYILAVAAVTGWGMNVRYLRRIHHSEMKAVTDQKRLMQQERTPRRLGSSTKNK
jgi:hypothetical protein